MVKEMGNFMVQDIIYEVFEVMDWLWCGMEVIFMSGYEVKEKYVEFDVKCKFNVNIVEVLENEECIVGEIMKGIKKLFECFNFGIKCKFENLLGVFMVSLEGVCVVYYYFLGMINQLEG